jgi:hypothetical protein
LTGKVLLPLFLVCINGSASLILNITDPNQTAAPGAHAVYHGSLLNTDSVGYTVLSFVTLSAPTDATSPPTADQLFPIGEPAVPFGIAAGAQFTGIVLDITVPLNAQTRSHPFAVEAATNLHGLDGNTIVSNTVLLNLDIAAPEPNSAILFVACLAALPILRKFHQTG